MAELAPSKKYFNLENVRIAYKAKDDTFHLTAQDEDFPEGFHMTLGRNTNLDVRVRELFEDHGLLTQKQAPAGAQEKHRGIVVGPPAVARAVAKLRKDWTFLPSVPTVAALWEGLGDGSISPDLDGIIIVDDLFDESGKDKSFGMLAASMMEHCFFAIVKYNPVYSAAIRDAIDKACEEIGLRRSSMYFFIEPQYPNSTWDTAWSTYEIEQGRKEEPLPVATL